MRKVNWDDIQENEGGEFPRPAPGGYIARIINVEDVEEKEYLRIEWDFAEGEYKDFNADTYNRAGFWPIALIRSYKPKALPFFKAFKTALEASNKGYVFRENEIDKMAGRLFGVVLGEEEYTNNKGEVKTRLYVYQTRSGKAIRDGDYKVPELKRLKPGNAQVANNSAASNATFPDFEDVDGDLPF